jgi:hypothetical protein
MRRLSLILALVIALAGLGSVGLPARPAAAQDGLVWQAQFFNNDVLSGAPIFSTQYDSLRINWGEGRQRRLLQRALYDQHLFRGRNLPFLHPGR